MSGMGKRAVVAAVVMGSLLGASEASAAKLSIELKKDEVTYPKTDVGITVELDTETGASAEGYEVKLLESRFPFKKAKVVDRETFGNDGTVRFRARAEYNSKYQAVVEDGSFTASSKKKSVYVFPKLTQDGEVTDEGRFKTSFRVQYSPQLPVKIAGSKVSFYFRKVDGGKYVRKDTARAKQTSPGTVVARGEFGLPSGRYRFQSLGCIDFPRKPLGMFGPDYRYFKCPKKLSPRSGRVAPRIQPAAAFSSLSASPFIP